MLSDLLSSYAGHFAAWAREGGVQMSARVCSLMHANMIEAAEQARQIEAAQVPGAYRAPLPPGVVSLDQARAARRA